MCGITKKYSKKENGSYKMLEGGLKAAQKQNLKLYDAEGQIVHRGVLRQIIRERR